MRAGRPRSWSCTTTASATPPAARRSPSAARSPPPAGSTSPAPPCSGARGRWAHGGPRRSASWGSAPATRWATTRSSSAASASGSSSCIACRTGAASPAARCGRPAGSPRAPRGSTPSATSSVSARETSRARAARARGLLPPAAAADGPTAARRHERRLSAVQLRRHGRDAAGVRRRGGPPVRARERPAARARPVSLAHAAPGPRRGPVRRGDERRYDAARAGGGGGVHPARGRDRRRRARAPRDRTPRSRARSAGAPHCRQRGRPPRVGGPSPLPARAPRARRRQPRALETGAADAVLVDALEAPLIEAHLPWVAAVGPLTHDRKAYLARDPALADALDRWLRAREADGSLAQLRARWFGAAYGTPKSAFASDLDALLALIDLRLAFMPAVATAKAARGRPVEDAAQEARVRAAVAAEAVRHGLAPETAEALFGAQIEAARAIEHATL